MEMGKTQEQVNRRRNVGESFKDLIVWQRAVQLAVAVYKLTSAFPDSERFGLISQLRRASVSVASDIAEGYGRATTGEYLVSWPCARLEL
jgi:four helix bundle protein